MALQMKLEMDTGIILTEAYVRITDGIFSLDRGVAFITIQTYANKEARDNKKKAVKIHETQATMDGSKQQRDAKYTVNIVNADVGSKLEFAVDLTGDSKNEISLIEGTHITTDGTLGTYTKAIVDKLNKNADFMYDFLASSTVEGYIVVTPLASGSKTASKGNGVVFSGSSVQRVDIEQGQDRVLANFEKFFSVDVMDKAGNNVIKQAYEFIKTLPEYQGAIDVL